MEDQVELLNEDKLDNDKLLEDDSATKTVSGEIIKDELSCKNVQNDNTASFKMPALITQKPKSAKLKPETEAFEAKTDVPIIQAEKRSQEHESKPAAQIPYKEPDWSSKPSPSYSLEVLKNGQIVSSIELSSQPFTVFGRMECCHVVMEHPSVSRFHAVLQYRGEKSETEESGFYIYDLESTHGTYLNKQQLRPRTYYKMHVGHMLKLGGSSRNYILQGPDEDQEPEDELSVTELKARRRALEETARAKLAEETNINTEINTSTGDGIDWGFGEDATEDPITENPFAVSAPNEDLYLEDPKKTLRGWFEREGYDLEYNVEEKGFGHFLCRIELPIDSSNGESVFAEASVKGKKKESVVAAALEACRILDRHGVLRQSQHDSRKRKEKDWESQDFYDSEEDTYLDRTGTIERKRQFRKKLVKRDSQDSVETYDSLIEKLRQTEDEIDLIQKKLEEAKKAEKVMTEVNVEQDSLEAYMANLKNMPTVLDKKAKSQLVLQLSALQQDKLHLEKLVKIAQPTVLPPLQTQVTKNPTETKKSLMQKLMPMTGAIRGRTLGKGQKGSKSKLGEAAKALNLDNQATTTSNKLQEEGKEEQEPEEVEEEEEDQEPEKKEKQQERKKIEEQQKRKLKEVEEKEDKRLSNQKIDDKNNTGPAADILKKTELGSTSDARQRDGDKRTKTGIEKEQITVTQNQISGPTCNSTEEKKKRQRRMNHRKAKLDSSDPDYSMWLPPDNQTGDGKTHLNQKFGY